MRRTFLAALIPLFGACASLPAGPGVETSVFGRVLLAGEPLAGARVGAWSMPNLVGTAPVAETRTGEDGSYRLPLPPGCWNVAVLDLERGKHAWSGLNPLRLAAGDEVAVGFKAAHLTLPARRPAPDGAARVRARLMLDDRPVPGARLSLYLDAADDFRGPGFALSVPADDEGWASIEGIPPGSYWLLARKRRDDRTTGPVEPGDLVGFHPFNPLDLGSGVELTVQVALAEKRKNLFPTAGTTLVAGTVRDQTGSPAEGVYVFAYPREVVGHEKPAAVSPATGSDGRYSLTLPGGGIWYLGARERYGVNPQPGERYGLYPGTADHSLEVGAGERRDGVDLVVEAVLGWEE